MTHYNNNSTDNFFFDADKFVQDVIYASKMHDVAPATREKLAHEIKLTLHERITEAVISQFGERELFLMNKLLEDHPSIDEVDAMSLIVPTVPDLSDHLLKVLNDLFEELVTNAAVINMKINN